VNFVRKSVAGHLQFVQQLAGSLVVDFAVQEAMHELRQGLLYGFCIV